MKWWLIVGLAVWVGFLVFVVQMDEYRIVQLEMALAQAHAEVDTLEVMLSVGD